MRFTKRHDFSKSSAPKLFSTIPTNLGTTFATLCANHQSLRWSHSNGSWVLLSVCKDLNDAKRRNLSIVHAIRMQWLLTWQDALVGSCWIFCSLIFLLWKRLGIIWMMDEQLNSTWENMTEIFRISEIWMFWVSGCVVQILSWLGGRWGEVHSHHCVQDRLGSTLNNLTNGTGLGLGFVATRNKQHVHHVACTFSIFQLECRKLSRYQYHLASSAERIRLSLRKTSKGPAPMAMCSLISFGLCMVYVWAMHGLCQLHGMKEKQIRERERARSHAKSKCFCQLSSTSTVARTDGCGALVHHVVFDNLTCNSFPLGRSRQWANQSIQNLYELVASTFHSSDCCYSGLGFFCPRHHTFA